VIDKLYPSKVRAEIVEMLVDGLADPTEDVNGCAAILFYMTFSYGLTYDYWVKTAKSVTSKRVTLVTHAVNKMLDSSSHISQPSLKRARNHRR
jgi:hypothetical protein